MICLVQDIQGLNRGSGMTASNIARRRAGRWAAAAAALTLLVPGCGTLPRPPESTTGAYLCFGTVADIQYAGKPDSGPRHYGAELDRLQDCVNDLNRRGPDFVVQLGDTIDGYEKDPSRSAVDLDRVLGVLRKFDMPVYPVIGNHCLNAGRENLQQKLGLPRSYYDFALPAAKGWRFVVLDGTEDGYGAIGAPQLHWFRAMLAKARYNREKVICFCHFPLIPTRAGGLHMQDPEPLLRVIESTDCVVAWIAGHDHPGGYVERNGVHYLTMKGMVESSPASSYALIELQPDRIHVIGTGDEPSRDLPLKVAAPAPQPRQPREPQRLPAAARPGVSTRDR
jgi:manganese-dependent ADP-ribose/CDP-alcohol diphosphatase